MFTTRTNDNRKIAFLRFLVCLRSKEGFTLTEVLATVIILGLVTAGMATAITVGVQQFNKSMALSEGQQLYSSISRLLENDLRFSGTPDASGPVTSYQSINYSDERTLYLEALDDDGNVVSPSNGETTGYGQLALCSHDDGSVVKNYLLGRAAYNYGLRAKVERFDYDATSHNYTIELVIGNPTQSYDVVDETFTVYSLRGAQKD